MKEEKRNEMITTIIFFYNINNEENNFRVEIVLRKKHDAFYRFEITDGTLWLTRIWSNNFSQWRSMNRLLNDIIWLFPKSVHN